ncbi:uncharacterized protein LACBIDRAFT_317994 [Laccaria bicolor S238N-H82]|uniref:Predicted protein n=1 Tax=Laccaria bicolor (strain S238N-H82 / ATCC MYA-4686) TaxID=486041 RepID=B0D5P9_LACBS|nr:uncharacterized protein LACBIDRAFT_317994 [Laccaria bicolor S238N-H82]EDR10057.1 predicted protein [Laccaria bicolor S238N-H82]|eukprot:XP_001879442.1 predicted protein [Laccaria bicolor S238N-H82]
MMRRGRPCCPGQKFVLVVGKNNRDPHQESKETRYTHRVMNGNIEEVGEGITTSVKGDRAFAQGQYKLDWAAFQQYTKTHSATKCEIPLNFSYDKSQLYLLHSRRCTQASMDVFFDEITLFAKDFSCDFQKKGTTRTSLMATLLGLRILLSWATFVEHWEGRSLPEIYPTVPLRV